MYFNYAEFILISKLSEIDVTKLTYDSAPTKDSKKLVNSGSVYTFVDKNDKIVTHRYINNIAEQLFKNSEKFQAIDDISSQFEYMRGAYVTSSLRITPPDGVKSYGCLQISVSKGNLYLFQFQYTINAEAYKEYSGFCFHKNNLTEGGYADYSYLDCVGEVNTWYSIYFIAPEDGYISAYQTAFSFEYKGYKISIDENDYTKLKEITDNFGYLDEV